MCREARAKETHPHSVIFSWKRRNHKCLIFARLYVLIIAKVKLKVHIMGRPQARKKQHKGTKPMSSKYRLRKKTKDLDQIHFDMKPDQIKQLLNQEVDYDTPGNAQFYCVHCARYFISNGALETHFKTKSHKKRMKLLAVEPYTQKEAERAAGMGSYIAPKMVQITSQPSNEVLDVSQVIDGLSSL